MVPQLLVLALAFHRAPLGFAHLTDPTQPLPDGFGEWLAEAVRALAPQRIQSTAAALGIEPAELQEAFLFFLRQTLLSPRADYYRVLGLSRHSSATTVKRHHGLLVRMFHPDRMPGEAERNSVLTARINTAYQALGSPEARRRYDMALPLSTGRDQTANWSPEMFRPGTPLERSRRRKRSPLLAADRLRRGITWTLAAFLLAVVLFLVLGDERPILQSDHEAVQGVDPAPVPSEDRKPKTARLDDLDQGDE